MKWFFPILLLMAAVFVYFKQQSSIQKTEYEFASKIVEVKKHKFIVPDLPEKDLSFEISESEIKKMRRQLKSSDLGLKDEAMLKLWKAQDETIIPALNRIMDAKYHACYDKCGKIAEYKLHALDILSRDQSLVNLKILLKAVKDKNKDVRLSSINIMGNYLAEDVIDPLQRAMSDKNEDVSIAAGRGLEKVINGMNEWRKSQTDQLIREYSRKLSISDYSYAERRLRKIIRKIEKESTEQ
ncbi:MAG: HEAT repeat domain-containing protein [Elusimicrobiales bacterium]|nr:HEAT repeat domain-containing protein [Elusimicrobiales bacterium]